jgi:hypothetical protein
VFIFKVFEVVFEVVEVFFDSYRRDDRNITPANPARPISCAHAKGCCCVEAVRPRLGNQWQSEQCKF